jgi:prevent-host-death family protein
MKYDYHEKHEPDQRFPHGGKEGPMRVSATVTDVLRNFSDYINRVAYRGERFVLTRGGKEVAELVPAPPAGRRLSELPGVLRALPRLDDDEASRLAEDLASARQRLAAAPPDPWAS